MKRNLALAILGVALGYLLSSTPAKAQNGEALSGIDSSTNAPVAIQTNGTNALKVISK